MTDTNTLAPCPFCGAAPKTIERPDNIDGTEFVYAVFCHCGGHSATAHRMAHRKTQEQAKRDAIATWNTRATAPAQPVDGKDSECEIPPLGWRCTRTRGHDGPCAAVESPEDKAFVERGMRRIRDAEDAGRYRLLKRGQHWSVIDGAGSTLRAEALDAAIDAAIAGQQGEKA